MLAVRNVCFYVVVVVVVVVVILVVVVVVCSCFHAASSDHKIPPRHEHRQREGAGDGACWVMAQQSVSETNGQVHEHKYKICERN